MHRRALLAAVIAFTPILAIADESISGQWEANLGHNVIIAMDMLADGHWTSQTVQSNKVVAEMAGSYEQKKVSATTGTLVFTPVKSKTTDEHGAAQVEDGPSPEEGVRSARLREAVMRFEATLSPAEATVFRLSLVEERTLDETAGATGMSARRCKYLRKKLLVRAAADPALRAALGEVER